MPKRRCSLDDCDKPHHARGYCSGHRHRADRYGRPDALTRRGVTDDECVLDAVTARLPLWDNRKRIAGWTVIDLADYEWLKTSLWFRMMTDRRGAIDPRAATYTWYAVRNHPDRNDGGQTLELMHRAIMGCAAGDGLLVDHRNRNKLDNRRANLRFLDTKGNSANVTPVEHTGSLFPGVRYDPVSGTWSASRTLHLGSFRTEAAALAATEHAC